MKPAESIKEQIDLLNAFGIKLPDDFEFYQSISFIKQKMVWLKPKTDVIGSPRQMPISRWEYQTRVRVWDEIHKAFYHSAILNSFLLLQYVTRNTYNPNRFHPDFTGGYSFKDMFALRTIKEKVFFFQMSSLFPGLFLVDYGQIFETLLPQNKVKEMFCKRDGDDTKKSSSETLFQEWVRFLKSYKFTPFGNFNQIYCSLVKMEIDNVTKQKTFLER